MFDGYHSKLDAIIRKSKLQTIPETNPALLMAGQLGHFQTNNLIEKGKKYLKSGQNPPKGVVTHRGPQGGTFYYVEDKHVKQAGKEHELIRSKGVTKHQFEAIEKKYRSQGAENVHFVHKPGLEKDKAGNNLYNIYVNWGDKTQKKISDKKAADKIRYGHPRAKDVEEPIYTETDGTFTTPAFNRTNKGYIESGRYEIRPSGDRGAKLYYIDKKGGKHKVKIAFQKVWGDKDEYDVNNEASRKKNVETLKGVVKELNRSGKKRRDLFISNQKRIDEEKVQEAEKNKNKPPKAPEKNPNWELHQAIIETRKMKKPKGIPEIEAHEAALQHKRGSKPVKEFLTEHLKKHYPGTPVKVLTEAARSAFYRYSADEKNPHRLSDAFLHGVNTLTRLLRHPPAEEKPAPGPVKFPQRPKPQVTLPHSETPGMKRWVRKITHYFPGNDKQGALDNSVFLTPDTEAVDSKTFTLDDGLYESAMGPKSGFDSHLIRYHVKNGKLREIDTSEYYKELRQLPFIPAEEILAKIKRDSDAKAQERKKLSTIGPPIIQKAAISSDNPAVLMCGQFYLNRD